MGGLLQTALSQNLRYVCRGHVAQKSGTDLKDRNGQTRSLQGNRGESTPHGRAAADVSQEAKRPTCGGQQGAEAERAGGGRGRVGGCLAGWAHCSSFDR